MKKFLFIGLVIISLSLLAYLLQSFFLGNNPNPSETGTYCGGWNTFGEVICQCSGQLKNFTCPFGAVCDSGRNTCYGTCGECKCYQGQAKNNIEIPCNGEDYLFKNIDLYTNPSYCQSSNECIAIANPSNGCYFGYFNKNASAAIKEFKDNKRTMIQDCPNFSPVYCDTNINKCTANRLK